MTDLEKLYLFNLLKDKEGKKYNKATLKTAACRGSKKFEEYGVNEYKNVIDEYSRLIEPEVMSLVGKFRGKVVKINPSKYCPDTRVYKIQNKLGYNRVIYALGKPYSIKNEGFKLYQDWVEKVDEININDLLENGVIVPFEEFDKMFSEFPNRNELKIRLYNLRKFKNMSI